MLLFHVGTMNIAPTRHSDYTKGAAAVAIDGITGRCGRISVWQTDGEGGTAHVTGTKMIDRVPAGTSLQWLGIRVYERVDERPSLEHVECACVYHLDTHESVWVHRDGYTANSGGRRNGLHHYCNECRAFMERKRRAMKDAKARWYAKMSA